MNIIYVIKTNKGEVSNICAKSWHKKYKRYFNTNRHNGLWDAAMNETSCVGIYKTYATKELSLRCSAYIILPDPSTNFEWTIL